MNVVVGIRTTSTRTNREKSTIRVALQKRMTIMLFFALWVINDIDTLFNFTLFLCL